MGENNAQRTKISWVLLCGIFLFMLLLNWWMPIHRDDYDYSMIWGTSQHIASFGDVWKSLVGHYMLHGGRMVTVFFLDLFLWFGKVWFDIANAAVFTAVVALVYFHARRRLGMDEPVTLGLTAFLMWLCLPHFGEVAVWKSGSTVYLWSGFFILLFLLPYNLYMAGRFSWGRIMALPMMLLGIPAGWSVENFAVTTVCITAVLSFWSYKKGHMPLWMPAGCAGAVLGFIGILAAPGNYVRYGEQSGGKGILIHIGNQFAGNGEMLMYLLPAILLLLLAWHVLQQNLTDRKVIPFAAQKSSFTSSQWVMLLIILVLTISYFSGGLVGAWIRDFLISHVMTPLHLTRPKTIYQFSNVMAGFEEMVIFWMALFFVFSLAKKALGFSKDQLRRLRRQVRAKELWQAYPEVRYAGVLIGLCFFNNLVMLAAPTFPARATFGSVLLFIAGTAAVLRIGEVRRAFAGRAGQILCIGGGAIGLFIAAAAVLVSWNMTSEHNARIAYIEAHAGSGEVLELPPITMKNRALRHVFFVDFGNGVTKGGLCRYYGIKDIEIKDNAEL